MFKTRAMLIMSVVLVLHLVVSYPLSVPQTINMINVINISPIWSTFHKPGSVVNIACVLILYVKQKVEFGAKHLNRIIGRVSSVESANSPNIKHILAEKRKKWGADQTCMFFGHVSNFWSWTFVTLLFVNLWFFLLRKPLKKIMIST